MRKIKTRKAGFDLSLLGIIIVLCFLGVVLVYDSSVVRAAGVFGGKYYFLIFQSVWVSIGLAIFYFTSNFDYGLWENLSGKLLFLSVLFLILTIFTRFMPPSVRGYFEFFVPNVNGSHRWIYLNYKPLPPLPLIGRLGFQPSELAKISLVIYLPFILRAKKKEFSSLKSLFLVFAISFLILLQPDFGTSLIIALTGIAVYMASGAPLKTIFFLASGVALLGLFFILNSSYRRARLVSYLNLNPSSKENLSTKYQINQVLIALGSGGFFGLGLGQSRQKYDYIPEVNTDSIFSVWGEETGFLGSLFLISLLAALVYRGFFIASVAAHAEGMLMAVGITSFVGLQTLINLLGMTHLLPLTGVPLPLLSYGGSSLLVVMASLGILLNVSRDRKQTSKIHER